MMQEVGVRQRLTQVDMSALENGVNVVKIVLEVMRVPGELMRLSELQSLEIQPGQTRLLKN